MQQLEPPFTIRNEIARKAFNYLSELFSEKANLPNAAPIAFQGNCVGIELWLRSEPPHVVAAGFLHQVLNEGVTTPENIESEFGEKVRSLIEAVSYSGRELFAIRPEEVWMEALQRIELDKKNHGPLLIMLKSFNYQLRFMEYLRQGDARQQLYDLSKRCLGVGLRNMSARHYAVADLQGHLKLIRTKFPALDDH